MKSVVLNLFIILLTAGFSYAADTQDNTQQLKPGNRNYSLKTSSYSGGRYSRTLNDMIRGALKMDLSDEQKAKVSELSNDYVNSMSKDEKELGKANMDIRKMLEDPSFDPMQILLGDTHTVRRCRKLRSESIFR